MRKLTLRHKKKLGEKSNGKKVKREYSQTKVVYTFENCESESDSDLEPFQFTPELISRVSRMRHQKDTIAR